MKHMTIAAVLVACSALSGCVVDGGPYSSAPYYGGTQPYYGSAYVSGGGYYPAYRSVNVYSDHNRNYWHDRHHAAQPQGNDHGNRHDAPHQNAGHPNSGHHDDGHNSHGNSHDNHHDDDHDGHDGGHH